MPASTPFAQVTQTPETLIAQVIERVLHGGLANDTSPQTVEQVATIVVQELWQSPVKTFILVLATREVQEALRTPIDVRSA